jgi:DNA repair exonuclease SbcCD nuclease subunit
MDYVLDNELTPGDFPSWYNAVILGHLHRSQQVSHTVFYLGSPLQNAFGEGSNDVEKYIYEYDPENNQLTNIPVDAPKFITHLVYDENASIEIDDYNYYWLKVRDGVMPYEEIEELRDMPNIRLDIIPKEISKERLKLESEFSVNKIVEEYADYKEQEPDVKEYGLGIIKDADWEGEE